MVNAKISSKRSSTVLVEVAILGFWEGRKSGGALLKYDGWNELSTRTGLSSIKFMCLFSKFDCESGYVENPGKKDSMVINFILIFRDIELH